MKNVQKTGFVLFVLSALFLSSCKKDKFNLSADIKNIIPTSMLTELKSKGIAINEGTTPPSIEGIYLASPYTLKSPYGPGDGWSAGKVINDYKYKFYDQTGGNLKVDYKQPSGSDQGSGLGSFISGSGNKFSVFSASNGSTSSIQYTTVSVISGELTSTGIKDFQCGFIFTKKAGDDGDVRYVPVGKSRVWVDGDAFAEKISTFRMGNNNINSSDISAMSAK